MVRILVGGDICPIGRIQNAFIEGESKKIFHDLLEEVINADLSIANLECPFISNETPIIKDAVLGADTKCIQGFISSGWNLINLANNHSFDHGPIGLQGTIDIIKKAGLGLVGAGMNLKEAQTPFIKEINGLRIVIYSMAEREFSVADDDMAGSNPLDLINLVSSIREYKQRGIFIILLHGGKEFYPYPSPEMVRRCRFMIDMGADAVICSHTHCPLPWENYNGRPIIYGLGNLIFEPFSESLKTWHEGYLAKLTIEDNGIIHLEAIPYLQSQKDPGAKKMDETAKRHFFAEMESKRDRLKDNVFLKAEWIRYSRNEKNNYLSWLFGYNKPMLKMRRFLLPLLHRKNEILRALLLAQCETHQEILNTLFKDERQRR